MEYVRLSFRLLADSESARTWALLKEKHAGKTDIFIFEELLRRERIRLDNKETHTDILREVRQQVSGASTEDLKELLLKILGILEKFHA